MRPVRWLGLAAVGALLLGLAACSTPTTSGGTGTPVSVTPVGTVPWLSVQDGSGAWQALSGTSFIVNDSQGRFGVAWECTQGSGQAAVHILQATTAESTGITASCQATPTSTTYTLTGTVSGIPSGGYAVVSLGGAIMAVLASNPTYTLPGVSAGVQTAVAYGVTSSGTPATMVVSRNVSVTGNMTWSPNVSSGTVFTMDTLSLSGVPSGETPLLQAGLVPSGAGLAWLAENTVTSAPYGLVPAALGAAGDSYLFVADASNSGYWSGSGGADQEVAFAAQAPATTTSLPLPAALSGGAGVGVTGATATATWGSVSFVSSGGIRAYSASVVPTAVTSPSWRVLATAGWLGSATSYTFPSFAATTGWNASWNFPTSQAATAYVAALHTTLTLSQLAAALRQGMAGLPNGATVELTQEDAAGTY